MNEQAEKTDEPVAPPDALRDAFSKIGELRGYGAQYIFAKIDLAKAGIRNAAVLAALGIVALFAGAATIVIALVLMLSGLSGAIAVALGNRPWAGELIVGGGLLLIFVLGAWIGLKMLRKSWLNATVKKYELQQTQQRARYGQDARECAEV